ncbi:MAG: TonB-dependent receptor [Pseudomonadales bacterium]|nr:TonB-dependent receptor [Pseudomonadales bacterium]
MSEAEGRHNSGALIDEIVVTANPTGRSRLETLQGTSVLSGEHLDEKLSATIGDTIASLPGLSQSAFGQAASRPIVRGLSGDRLRVLTNDLGTFDASTSSPDHAVALDLSSATRVEVVRGPTTLMYGADAVAGVINVIDARVPQELPEEGRIDGFVRTGVTTNANQKQGNGALSAQLTEHVMANFGASWLDTDNFKAPGFLRSPALRTAEPPAPGEDEVFGLAPNSDQRNWALNGGLSYVGDSGSIGAAVSHWDNNYGIPLEDAVRIDARQTRVDVIGETRQDFLVFEQARFRFGYGDYEQVELEDGTVGTRFDNQEWESRLDLIQQPWGNLSGTLGVQLRSRDFTATGDEVFVAPSDTFGWGLFALESYELGRWRFDGSLRVDRQTIDAGLLVREENGQTEVFGGEKPGFTGISISSGLSYTFDSGYLLGLSAFRIERLPTAAELFSGGPELATQTFVLGDPNLGEETLRGFETSVKKTEGALTLTLDGYYYNYKNFITQSFTGGLQSDNLREVSFTPVGARLYGLELEASYEAWRRGEQALLFDLIFDKVEAEQRDGGKSLPRIPPQSLSLGIEYQHRLADFRLDAELAANQKDLADFETAPGSYVNLSATLTLHPFADEDILLIIQGRNLTDDTIRHHTSFLQDRVPAPGRDLRVTLRVGF